MLSPAKILNLLTLNLLLAGLSVPAQAQDFSSWNVPTAQAQEETNAWADFNPAAPVNQFPQIQAPATFAPQAAPFFGANSLPATSTSSVDLSVTEPSEFRQCGAGLLPEPQPSRGGGHREARGVRRAI